MLGSTIAQAATTPNYYFLPTAAKVVVKGNSSKNELEYIPPAGTPKYWTFNFTLPKASAGVETMTYTISGGIFSGGKKKITTSTKTIKTQVFSNQSHVDVVIKPQVSFSSMSAVIQPEVKKLQTSFVFPAPFIVFDKSTKLNMIYDILTVGTPSSAYVVGVDIKTKNNNTVFYFKYDETPAQLHFVKTTVANIEKQIFKPGMDEFAKELAIHNWIVSHISYRLPKKNSYSTDYAALSQGKADCVGVTELTYQMLSAAGIRSRMVTGHVHSGKYILRGEYNDATVPKSESDTAHIWNEVDLNGTWYMLDVTSDLKNNNHGHASFRGLNLTNAQLENTQTWIQSAFPSATTNFVTTLEHSKNPQDKQILHAIEG